MTQEERNQVGMVIAYTAQYYGKDFKKEVIAMMLSDLDDLSMAAVLEAYNRYRKDPKSKFFPLPAQIREIVSPQISIDAEARAIVSRIIQSITRFGYCNGKEARLFIGEVGWSLVKEQGGWSYICENHGRNLNPGVFEAQLKQRAVDKVQYGEKLEVVGERISLGSNLAGVLDFKIKSILSTEDEK